MTTTSKNSAHAVEDKGLAGIAARLKAGRASGWGVFHPGSWPMMIGGMMLIVSAFLPWVYLPFIQDITGETFAFRGTDGPGVITLSVGCLAFAGAFVPRRRLAIAHAGIPGLVVAAIVLLQCWNLVAFSAQLDAWGGLLPGMGLVLAGGGAVILLKVTWRMWSAWSPR
ncbi:hypothetical protein [Nesterenkonia flava]|uniref:Uncharacterized protein n=1 Tax=Nesterenkonia flava TaxID=469799 RepID=A0ABU1FTJ7_9MICC|nr:hypothetical protein [Nesterenkonia flava]MDR5711975.1 hypothetical protein [Nesterenkonia flava]